MALDLLDQSSYCRPLRRSCRPLPQTPLQDLLLSVKAETRRLDRHLPLHIISHRLSDPSYLGRRPISVEQLADTCTTTGLRSRSCRVLDMDRVLR